MTSTMLVATALVFLTRLPERKSVEILWHYSKGFNGSQVADFTLSEGRRRSQFAHALGKAGLLPAGTHQSSQADHSPLLDIADANLLLSRRRTNTIVSAQLPRMIGMCGSW